MPPLRHGFDIESIVDSLIDSGHLVEEYEGSYVWREFQHLRYKNARENVVYNKPLKNIFDAIIRAAQKTSSTSAEPTVTLINDGNTIPWSIRDSITRPDGYLVLQNPEESMGDKVLWYNIAVALEFKTGTGAEHVFQVSQYVTTSY